MGTAVEDNTRQRRHYYIVDYGYLKFKKIKWNKVKTSNTMTIPGRYTWQTLN